MADLVALSRKILGPRNFSEELGRIIFAYRMKRGLTQSELATKAEVDPTVIYRIEGGSNCSNEDFQKVVTALALTNKMIGESLVELSEE